MCCVLCLQFAEPQTQIAPPKLSTTIFAGTSKEQHGTNGATAQTLNSRSTEPAQCRGGRRNRAEDVSQQVLRDISHRLKRSAVGEAALSEARVEEHAGRPPNGISNSVDSSVNRQPETRVKLHCAVVRERGGDEDIAEDVFEMSAVRLA